jgi:hypothetical protein
MPQPLPPVPIPPFTGGAPAVVRDVNVLIARLGERFRIEARNVLEEAGMVVVDTLPLPTENPQLDRLLTVPERPANLDLISIAEVLRANDELRTRLTGLIGPRVTEYFSNVFPLDGNLALASAWIERVLSGQGGLEPAFEERLWERQRSRALRDAQRAQDEVLATFSSRGYALPPGAAVGAIAMVQRTALEQSAAASRDIAVEVYRTEVQLMKDAVDAALRMRVEAIRNASEFVSIAAIEPRLINEIQQGTSAIYGQLVDSARKFFELDLAFNRVRYEQDKDFIQFARDYQKFRYEVAGQQLENRVRLALQHAQSAATQAAASLNGLHAQAQISGSDQTSIQIIQ